MMPRKRRSSSPFELFDDDFEEDASSQSSKNGNPPVQRNAANARERARMRVLSSAFGRLKTKLPNIPPDTKLSKLDTLRLATMYIKQLKTLVEGGSSIGENNDFTLNAEQGGSFNNQYATQSMTWPFGFHHIQNTSRQLAFQYQPPSMDWSHSQETYAKFQRIDNDNNYAENPNSNATTHWYMNGGTINETNNSSISSCIFDNSNQHNPNQRSNHEHQQHSNSHPHSMHHHHQHSHNQNAQTSSI